MRRLFLCLTMFSPVATAAKDEQKTSLPKPIVVIDDRMLAAKQEWVSGRTSISSQWEPELGSAMSAVEIRAFLREVESHLILLDNLAKLKGSRWSADSETISRLRKDPYSLPDSVNLAVSLQAAAGGGVYLGVEKADLSKIGASREKWSRHLAAICAFYELVVHKHIMGTEEYISRSNMATPEISPAK